MDTMDIFCKQVSMFCGSVGPASFRSGSAAARSASVASGPTDLDEPRLCVLKSNTSVEKGFCSRFHLLSVTFRTVSYSF